MEDQNQQPTSQEYQETIELLQRVATKLLALDDYRENHISTLEKKGRAPDEEASEENPPQ